MEQWWNDDNKHIEKKMFKEKLSSNKTKYSLLPAASRSKRVSYALKTKAAGSSESLTLHGVTSVKTVSLTFTYVRISKNYGPRTRLADCMPGA
jgi:hypothetical protein